MQVSANDFLDVPYVDGGRDMSGLDCFGQLRLARHLLFDKPLLESFGHITNNGCEDHYEPMTEVYHQLKAGYEQCEPRPGAIACCFRHGLLLHVGLVVEDNGLLKVLHTNAAGPHLMKIKTFDRLSTDVRFFDDRNDNNLSEQAGQDAA